MLKLLPDQDKKSIKQEYFFRFTQVFLGLINFILIVYLVLTLANYILIKSDRDISYRAAQEIQGSEFLQKQKKLEDISKIAEAKFNLLNQKELLPSFLLTELLTFINQEIILNVINVLPDQIEIRGLAKNRETLINLGNNLSQSEVFERVEIPFSSFTKSTDIPFNLNIPIKVNNQDE